MAEKVALPSLSLPKQKTHWSVGVVIAAGVLFLIMCAALYLVMQRQQNAEAAFAKRQADHESVLRAETEKAKADTERAAAETKKKEAEAAAAAAAAAAQKRTAITSSNDDAAKAKKKSTKKVSGGKQAKAGSPPTGAVTPAAPAKPTTKTSKDIDDLLKSFK